MRRTVPAIVGLACAGAALVLSSCTPAPQGVTRTYYVAADEVDWNYLPADRNELTTEAVEDDYHLMRGTTDSIMPWVFRKAVYRAYTDSTFATVAPRPPEWKHLGILGPVFRSVVGDTIVVVFRNNTQFPVSVHPHGVFYLKDSEGAPYADGTDGGAKHDDGVPPGEVHTYVWPVPERAGPGPADPNSIVWPYHSHTKELEDVHGGLIGAMIITRAGHARPDGSPNDVDREFVTMFAALDENTTRYTSENLARHTGDSARVNAQGQRVRYPPFGYHTINGLMFANEPLSSFTMQRGDRVRWYTFSSTGFNDFHTPHWHGGTLLVNQKRADVLDLGGPLLMVTADMIADNPGVWLLHCHFADHMEEGMSTRFEITQPEGA